MIVGDRDADGITSTALVADYLLDYGVAPVLRLPQGDEPYGLTTALVLEAQALGVSLIICVDNGSSAYEAANLAKSKQIDLIIFDHHDIGSDPLPAVAFVNPKRNEQYPNRQLSASVVVLKALFALDFYMKGYFERSEILLYGAQIDAQSAQIIALQVVNMEIKSVLQVTFPYDNPQKMAQSRQQMEHFLQGQALFVFGAQEQIGFLSGLLGADVVARDLTGELEHFYAGISQYRLGDLLKRSRFFCYQDQPQLRDGMLLLYRLLLLAEPNNFPHYERNFGLATIGLLADLAPLLGENRIIVQHGLRAMNSGENTKLNQLLSHLHLLNNTITINDLNWKFIPLINASGRMGSPDVALDALLSDESKDMQELSLALVKLNEQRRDLTTQWWEELQQPIRDSLERYEGKIIFIYQKDLPRGLTGLLAGRMARVYDTFSLVIAIKEDGTASASMRSPFDYHVAPFIEHCKDLFIDAGGHTQAGGFTIKIELIDELKRRLTTFLAGIETKPAVDDAEVIRAYDAKIPSAYFQQEVIRLVERLAPYGAKFEPLVFYISGVKLESATLIGRREEHLKLGITIGAEHWQALFWEEANRFGELRAGMQLDVLCKLRKESGRFHGYQLELIDFKES
nr:DHH family phosphoesterase [Entomospira culicis]